MPEYETGEQMSNVESVSSQISKADKASAEEAAASLGFDNVADYLLSLHRSYIGGRNLRRFGLAVGENHATEGYAPGDPVPTFQTDLGTIYQGDSSVLMESHLEPESVDLVMTSPPFGLVRKKDYGNEDADKYLSWFEKFAEGFKRVLKPNGSLVIDIGGAWKKGIPVRSLYHFELLIMLCREYGFHLAQEFFWWNPSKLPTPAEWVNIRRIRVKDAVNCIWWLSKTPYPKASNRRVLQPYSQSMKHLLKNGYKPKLRPSGHDISDKFQRDNNGAIPPNLIALANTESNGAYQRYCRKHSLKEHPARFPIGLPMYFIRMLTDPEDVVLDPFGGSCVTGEASEKANRRWICCELDGEYVEGAKGRFVSHEGQLFRQEAPSGRAEPYEILPPHTSLTNEQMVPLVEDGGRKRPFAKEAEK